VAFWQVLANSEGLCYFFFKLENSRMSRLPVTVTIITLNEEAHIENAIRSAAWAEEVVVVDSGSTDRTVEIAESLGAKVVARKWPGYGQQKNYAQQLARHEWVLNIDADEVIPAELADEIQDKLTQLMDSPDSVKGFYIARKTYYLGRWIRHGGWYPNYLLRMAHKNISSWTEPNVHEQLVVHGPAQEMKHPLHHHAFSSIEDQILTNLRFAKLGSRELAKAGQQPSIFRMIFKPIGKFIETYFLKFGFLDGLPGFIISVNAAHSMFLKYAFLNEGLIRRENTHRG
jgi:glycosyltransferase involved in cell wall biosynthesis